MNLLRKACLLFFIFVTPLCSAQHWLYTFRPGDTLWDLCLEYTTVPNCWQTIGDENGVDFPRQIPPGTVIKFPVNWLKTVPEPVSVLYVRGNVQYQPFRSIPLANLVVGQQLPIGSRIVVGDESTTTLLFANDSTLVLDANSELTLDALSSLGDSGMVDSRLRLLRGATTTKVPSNDGNIRFQIDTPAAAAAVRGTEFRVTHIENGDDVAMRAEVLEGIVAVSNTVDQQDVNQGFGLIAADNAPVPEPVELLPPPVITTDSTPQVNALTVNWQALSDAQLYRIALLSDDVTPELLATAEVNATSYTWSDLEEACYQISLSGIDAQTLQGMPALTQLCVVPPLGVADLNEESSKLVDGNLWQLSWNAVAGASQYELEISRSESFDTLIATMQTSQPTATYPVDPEGTYFARVRAITADGVKSETGQVVSLTPTHWDEHAIGLATIIVLILLL